MCKAGVKVCIVNPKSLPRADMNPFLSAVLPAYLVVWFFAHDSSCEEMLELPSCSLKQRWVDI